MTLVKAGGGFCGALLVFLLMNWASESIYHVGPEGHGAGEAQAYGVQTAEAAGGEAPAAAAGPDFATLYAAADPAAGEKVFGKCRACHKTDGNNATGPHLDGVVGRPVGSVEGFAYTAAMKSHGGDWTPERIEEFLTNPKGVVPGTKMSFAGLPKIEDRANLVAYLAGLGG